MQEGNKKAQKQKAQWGPTFGTRQSARINTDGRTIMEIAQENKKKQNLEIPKIPRTSQDMVEYLKNCKEMADPFQGIDDGLGGKFLPTNPSKNPAASPVDHKWLKNHLSSGDAPWYPQDPVLISRLTDDWARFELSKPKTLLLTMQAFDSPTPTLESGTWASPGEMQFQQDAPSEVIAG